MGTGLTRRAILGLSALSVIAPELVSGCGNGVAGSTSTTPAGQTSPFSNTPPPPPFTVNTKLFGLGLGPYVLPGQDPNTGTVLPANQVQYLVSDAAQYAIWLRTFGTSGALMNAGQYIHAAGAKAMIGAFIADLSTPSTYQANLQANQAELQRLVQIANNGWADIISVGNETLYTGYLTESQLLSYITYVRSNVSPTVSVQVSTVDTWSALQGHPNVIAACDVVLPTIYPFWENSPAPTAVAKLQSDYSQILQASGSKPVIIAETGWPSSGPPSSRAPLAIPSAANQLSYFVGAEQWARQNQIQMIWFEAYSEPWKANYNDYPSWGIFDSSYVIEKQFVSAFQ